MKTPANFSGSHKLLNAQSLSSFGAARINEATAIFSLHANTESVSALSWGVVWLVRTFHAIPFFKII
jgi:hypothetical protein